MSPCSEEVEELAPSEDVPLHEFEAGPYQGLTLFTFRST